MTCVWTVLLYFLYPLFMSKIAQQFKSHVISPGREGVLPDCSCPLHPLPDLSGCQSLFRTQEHALLRYIIIPHISVFDLNQLILI